MDYKTTKNLVEAAIHLKDGDEDFLGRWTTANPKLALILGHFRDKVKGHTDGLEILHGMCELYDGAVKDVGLRVLGEFEKAAALMYDSIDNQLGGDDQAGIDLLMQHLEPFDLFAAENDLLISPKFRMACREALLDMGDRPAGDVTLEQIMSEAFRLIMGRAIARGRRGAGKEVDV